MMYTHHTYKAGVELFKSSQIEYRDTITSSVNKETEGKMKNKELKIKLKEETLRTGTQQVSSENHHYKIALLGLFSFAKNQGPK